MQTCKNYSRFLFNLALYQTCDSACSLLESNDEFNTLSPPQALGGERGLLICKELECAKQNN